MSSRNNNEYSEWLNTTTSSSDIDGVVASQRRASNITKENTKSNWEGSIFDLWCGLHTLVIWFSWGVTSIFFLLLFSYAYCSIFSYCFNNVENIYNAIMFMIEKIIAPILIFIAGRFTQKQENKKK